MTNAADREKVSEKSRKERERLKAEMADLRHVLSDPRGRRVVWKLFDRAGIFRTSFNGNGSATFFNEGQRNIGLMFLNEVTTHCPELYLAMMSENRRKPTEETDG